MDSNINKEQYMINHYSDQQKSNNINYLQNDGNILKGQNTQPLIQTNLIQQENGNHTFDYQQYNQNMINSTSQSDQKENKYIFNQQQQQQNMNKIEQNYQQMNQNQVVNQHINQQKMTDYQNNYLTNQQQKMQKQEQQQDQNLSYQVPYIKDQVQINQGDKSLSYQNIYQVNQQHKYNNKFISDNTDNLEIINPQSYNQSNNLRNHPNNQNYMFNQYGQEKFIYSQDQQNKSTINNSYYPNSEKYLIQNTLTKTEMDQEIILQNIQSQKTQLKIENYENKFQYQQNNNSNNIQQRQYFLEEKSLNNNNKVINNNDQIQFEEKYNQINQNFNEIKYDNQQILQTSLKNQNYHSKQISNRMNEQRIEHSETVIKNIEHNQYDHNQKNKQEINQAKRDQHQQQLQQMETNQQLYDQTVINNKQQNNMQQLNIQSQQLLQQDQQNKQIQYNNQNPNTNQHISLNSFQLQNKKFLQKCSQSSELRYLKEKQQQQQNINNNMNNNINPQQGKQIMINQKQTQFNAQNNNEMSSKVYEFYEQKYTKQQLILAFGFNNNIQELIEKTYDYITGVSNKDVQYAEKLLDQKVKSISIFSSLKDYASNNIHTQQLIESYLKVNKSFPIQIQIRGDGNCFYRSVMISFLIKLVVEQRQEQIINFFIQVLQLNQLTYKIDMINMELSNDFIFNFLYFWIDQYMNYNLIKDYSIQNTLLQYNKYIFIDAACVVICRNLILNKFNDLLQSNDQIYMAFIEEEKRKELPLLLTTFGSEAEDVIIPICSQFRLFSTEFRRKLQDI